MGARILEALGGLIAVAGCAALVGCATIGTAQTASTLGKGRVQVGLEPAITGLVAETGLAYPRVDLAVRYGVADGVDVGGKIGSVGLEFGGKFRLTRPEAEEEVRRVVVSVAPTLGGALIGVPGVNFGSIYAQVPVLVGIPVGAGDELVLGPKIHDWYAFGDVSVASGGANLLSVGTTVGYAARMGERFRILPEIAVLVPVHGRVDAVAFGQKAGTGVETFGRGVLLQGSLALLFGGD